MVENKPGASANIGAEFVARSPADGYTVLVTAPNFTTSEALYEKLTWRFDDFIPVIHLVRYANVLVAAPGSQLGSVDQMIGKAKANPGALTFGSAGTGSNSHLAMELLKQRVGIAIEHVPYKGSGPLKTDLLGSHIPLGVDGLGGLVDLIKSGKVKALAVLAPKRTPLAPEIPSLGDMGINDVDGNGWYGALLPAGTPPAVVAQAACGVCRGARGARDARALHRHGRRAGGRIERGLPRLPARRAQEVGRRDQHREDQGRLINNSEKSPGRFFRVGLNSVDRTGKAGSSPQRGPRCAMLRAVRGAGMRRPCAACA